jgi:excisionase family DNA binding protein
MTRDDEEILTPIEVAELLRVPIATLYAWRHKRSGPPAAQVGRHLRYRRRDVEEWLESAVNQ